MDRTDAEQEGRILPPYDATRMIATDEARKVILQHLDLCPFAGLKIEARVRQIETSYARLTGFMAGAGVLGGASGAVITKLLNL